MNLKSILVTAFFYQNKHHRHSVLLHSIKVAYSSWYSGQFKYLIPSILHDIGKPFSAHQKPEDVANSEYSFTGHAELSYKMIRYLPFTSWQKNIVRYHYMIRDLAKSKRENPERYKKLKLTWDSFSTEFRTELREFIIHDDFGKR